MKGLLQSKIFRKNLKKWLCMYVGALLLLTTVITYSKYISEFNSDPENARITKFNFAVDSVRNNQIDCTSEKDNITEEIRVKCSTTNPYRPTTEIPYEFTIKPELEVSTILATTLYIDTKFEPIRLIDKTSGADITLYDTDNEKFYSKKEEDSEDKTKLITTISSSIKDSNNNEIASVKRTITTLKSDNSVLEDKITITKNLKVTDENINKIQTYHADIKYRYDEKEFENLVENNNLNDLSVLKIGYSAIQNK